MVIGKVLQRRQPEFPGWTLQADESRPVDFTAAHLDSILKNIAAGSISFVIAEPESPVRDCNFLQVCMDETQPFYYVEISLAQPDGATVLYGKGRYTASEVQTLLAEAAGDARLPDVGTWEKIGTYYRVFPGEGYKKLVRLLTEDEEVRARVEKCVADPRAWFDQYEYDYDARGTAIIPGDDVICWETLANELLGKGLAVEICPGDRPEDFIPQLAALAEAKSLPLQPEWFRPEEDSPGWAEILEEKWQETGYLPAALALDETSRLVFPCLKDRIAEIREAAEEIGHCIRPAREEEQL